MRVPSTTPSPPLLLSPERRRALYPSPAPLTLLGSFSIPPPTSARPTMADSSCTGAMATAQGQRAPRDSGSRQGRLTPPRRQVVVWAFSSQGRPRHRATRLLLLPALTQAADPQTITSALPSISAHAREVFVGMPQGGQGLSKMTMLAGGPSVQLNGQPTVLTI